MLTSPQAAAVMLADRHPAGAKVLVIGAPWLEESVRQAGLEPVRLAEDNPVAVVQGHSPDTGWRNLAEGCIALRAGADWVACNVDTTLPTDRGMLPGNGSMVAALVAATGLHPRVAGKPERPLLDAAVRLVGSSRPLVVGDRLDTDIACAVGASTPSLMVLTGVSTATDLLAADPGPSTHLPGLRHARAGRGGPGRAHPRPVVDPEQPEWTVGSDSSSLVLTLRTGRRRRGVRRRGPAGAGPAHRRGLGIRAHRCPAARPGRRGRADPVRHSRPADRIRVSGCSRTRWTEARRDRCRRADRGGAARPARAT